MPQHCAKSLKINFIFIALCIVLITTILYQLFNLFIQQTLLSASYVQHTNLYLDTQHIENSENKSHAPSLTSGLIWVPLLMPKDF